jgi:hypothetical protein
MIRCVVFSLALIFSAGCAFAQQPACTFYKVDTSVLNISQEPGGDRYIDALYDGDVACVTRTEASKGTDWAFIAQKLDSPTEGTPVQGWAPLKNLQQISSSEASALLADTSPASAKANQPNAAPANPAAQSAPAAAAKAPPAKGAAAPAAPAAHTNAAAAIRPEDVLRFDEPIPFGPFPINGHSIKEMIDAVPLFSPVEGLDDSLWTKKCTNCHQWNQDRLCQQALTYVRQPRFVLRVPHPFGGTLKLALMRWAKSGCP